MPTSEHSKVVKSYNCTHNKNIRLSLNTCFQALSEQHTHSDCLRSQLRTHKTEPFAPVANWEGGGKKEETACRFNHCFGQNYLLNNLVKHKHSEIFLEFRSCQKRCRFPLCSPIVFHFHFLSFPYICSLPKGSNHNLKLLSAIL